MFLPGLGLVIMIAAIVLAARYADMEGMSPFFWGVMSFLLWFVPGLFLPVNLFILVGLQVGLLITIRVLAVRQKGHFG